MTGDRLETDVQMALNAGMAGALVLTGATDERTLAASPIKPTYVLKCLADLLPTEGESLEAAVTLSGHSERVNDFNSAAATRPAKNLGRIHETLRWMSRRNA